jgi:hypothetical protein
MTIAQSRTVRLEVLDLKRLPSLHFQEFLEMAFVLEDLAKILT